MTVEADSQKSQQNISPSELFRWQFSREIRLSQMLGNANDLVQISASRMKTKDMDFKEIPRCYGCSSGYHTQKKPRV